MSGVVHWTSSQIRVFRGIQCSGFLNTRPRPQLRLTGATSYSIPIVTPTTSLKNPIMQLGTYSLIHHPDLITIYVAVGQYIVWFRLFTQFRIVTKSLGIWLNFFINWRDVLPHNNVHHSPPWLSFLEPLISYQCCVQSDFFHFQFQRWIGEEISNIPETTQILNNSKNP